MILALCHAWNGPDGGLQRGLVPPLGNRKTDQDVLLLPFGRRDNFYEEGGGGLGMSMVGRVGAGGFGGARVSPLGKGRNKSAIN